MDDHCSANFDVLVQGQVGEAYNIGGDNQPTKLELVRWDPRREKQCLKEILPAKSEQFPSLAKRPLYTPLNCDRFESTFGVSIPDWKVALRLAVEEYA